MTTVCWTCFSHPRTLVNVGMDAIAMGCDNLICCIDLKTRAKTYYKADSPTMGLGILLLAGHNRFPLFAFVEAVLRPSIYIIKYPDFSRFTLLPSEQVISYADMRFSESDHVVAISGHPHYILRIWNFRTGQLLAEHSTLKKSAEGSLICSANNIPVVMQFSRTHKELLIWELCLTAKETRFHEIAKISMPKEYDESYFFFACFAEDGSLYVVNDYGSLHSVEMGQFYLKRQWAATIGVTVRPRPHSLYAHKGGLVVANKEIIYFIRRKAVGWQVEWVLDEFTEHIVKMVPNLKNDLFAVNEVGNVYRVEVDASDFATLAPMTTANCNVQCYALIKGIKEDTILMLLLSGELRLVDFVRHNEFSRLQVVDGRTLAAHNATPFVAVGTSVGQIHLFSYEKIRAPVKVGLIDLDTTQIERVLLVDTSGLVQDDHNTFHIIKADFRQGVFHAVASVDTPGVRVFDYFILEENRYVIFLTKVIHDAEHNADEMWIYEWQEAAKTVVRTEFDLPHIYKDFSLVASPGRDSVELFAIRCNDSVIDVLRLHCREQQQQQMELELTTTIRTQHFSNLVGICGQRNLITWGVGGNMIHFRQHKKATKPYMISKFLQMNYLPRVVKVIEECCNGKFLLHLQANGCLKCFRPPPASDALRENSIVPDTQVTVAPKSVSSHTVQKVTKAMVVFEPTEADLDARAQVEQSIAELQTVVAELIDYDMSVTGKQSGIFAKFCLDYVWQKMLNEQARLLFDIERKCLLESIADQSRIRDWIRKLITGSTALIGTKIRAFFSNALFENYSIRKPMSYYAKLLELYSFYEMDGGGDEEDEAASSEDHEGSQTALAKAPKFYTPVDNMYDHVLQEIYRVQDKDTVMTNQMMNMVAKSKMMITDALKVQFNKKFNEVLQLKQEIMDSVGVTNGVLTKIYDNMNCMLRLLEMDTFTPEELTVTLWKNDEVLERIMTVDDSEIKAINRRKQKQLAAIGKRGRMLLWSPEFWSRALVIMMDGVLEKLWEEEIKKDVPMPEFLTKKQDHEFTLEDQKQLREYQEKVRLLALDRRKYLSILRENEKKTMAVKRNFIMKLNERCTEMAILKLKYDFAIKQEKMRVMSTKITHFRRIQFRKRIFALTADVEKMADYIERYTLLEDFWEKSVADMKTKLEVLTTRDKTLEKQFKNQFLKTIPAQLTSEMNKIFKRHPKMSQKSFGSTLVCMELAARIVQRSGRTSFPLPNECIEYTNALDALDDPQNMPNQLDPKHWETLVKLRRQKIENELKIKGLSYQLLDAQNSTNRFVKEVATLKNIRQEVLNSIEETVNEYYRTCQNQELELTLTMGQVEISIGSSINDLRNSILMNMDDVNEVNKMIKLAGAKKLRAMQRVAFFRRNVIFKEWEHKMVRANIDYLNYMLEIIEKCKVTMEFLAILRNWKKVKEARQRGNNFGLLERVVEQKIAAFRRNLDRLNEKIQKVQWQIERTKAMNLQINKAIDEVKISVAISNVNRDTLGEERRTRELHERMAKIKEHRRLIDGVRRDYAHILELSTILELQRLRTYPTLGPPPTECP